MSALGELIIVIVYIMLGLLVLISFLKLINKKETKSKIKWRVLFSISVTLLCLFSYSQFSNHNTAEQKKVGIYYLSSYPNCNNCILELKTDKTFEVRNDSKLYETGSWHYESGGDYWITYIGEYGQLGNGIYQYSSKKVNKTEYNNK